jgi:hypothetical protein
MLCARSERPPVVLPRTAEAGSEQLTPMPDSDDDLPSEPVVATRVAVEALPSGGGCALAVILLGFFLSIRHTHPPCALLLRPCLCLRPTTCVGILPYTQPVLRTAPPRTPRLRYVSSCFLVCWAHGTGSGFCITAGCLRGRGGVWSGCGMAGVGVVHRSVCTQKVYSFLCG